MAIIRKGSKSTGSNKSKVDYENLEEGDYDARLVYIADLGTHIDNYEGEDKPETQKLALGFEIVGNDVMIDGEAKPRFLWDGAFNVYSNLTPKGNEILKFSVFDPDAEAGDVPDWDAAIGSPCNLTVKHTFGKGTKSDTIYDTITRITAIPSKYQGGVAAARITDGCTGDCEDANNPAQKALFGLAKWQFDQRIVEGAEAAPKKEASKPTPTEEAPEQKEELFDGKDPSGEDEDLDIPF